MYWNTLYNETFFHPITTRYFLFFNIYFSRLVYLPLNIYIRTFYTCIYHVFDQLIRISPMRIHIFLKTTNLHILVNTILGDSRIGFELLNTDFSIPSLTFLRLGFYLSIYAECICDHNQVLHRAYERLSRATPSVVCTNMNLSNQLPFYGDQ